MSWLLSFNPWPTLVVAGLFKVVWASGVKYVGPPRPLVSLGASGIAGLKLFSGAAA